MRFLILQMASSFFRNIFANLICSRKEFQSCKSLRIDTVHIFVISRNWKMASEETFQSYEKGTHVPTVQKSRWMLFNVSRINMFTFKYSKRKK